MASLGTYVLDQLKTLLSKEVLNTIHMYFELKIIKVESINLYFFLQDRVHELFHYFVHQKPCCYTQSPCMLNTKQGTLTKEQFFLLYKKDPTIPSIHETKNKERIVKHCICPLLPNNALKVTDLDFTIINCLIKTCRQTPAGHPEWLNDIIEVRNCLSHAGNDSSVKDQDVHDWWKKLQDAAVNIAGTIGETYKTMVETRISEIRSSQSQLENLMKDLKRNAYFEQMIINALKNIVVHVEMPPTTTTAARKSARMAEKRATTHRTVPEETELLTNNDNTNLATAVLDLSKTIKDMKGQMLELTNNIQELKGRQHLDTTQEAAQPPLQVEGDFPFKVTGTKFVTEKPQISQAAQVSVPDTDTRKCIVLWKFSQKGNWDEVKMKEKLEHFKRIGDFDIEFVYQGCLKIHTAAEITILSDERRFKDSVEEFLFLFVQLLVIQEPTPASFDVALSIWLPELDGANQGEVLATNKEFVTEKPQTSTTAPTSLPDKGKDSRVTATEQFSSPEFPIDDIKPSLLKTFNVSGGHLKTCVTGCDILANGDFVIADPNQTYVKYYDNQGVLKKQINTESCQPYDVCFIDNNTIALSTMLSSANHEYILLVNTTDNMVIKKVQVGKGNKKLYFDEVLVVGHNWFSGVQVLIIDPNGDIKNKFKAKEIGGVFASNKMIYFTEENSVVCSDESATIRWKYQDPKIKYPEGIVVDDRGFVFVTCAESSSVVAITPDGQSSRVILSPDQGLKGPKALAINHENRQLMVCNGDDGKVSLYQL